MNFHLKRPCGKAARQLLGSASFILLGMASAAAQEQPKAGALGMEEIVVTASRVAQKPLEAAVPMVTLTGEMLQNRGITDLAASLNEEPQFGVTGISNVSSNFTNDGAGINTVNLRNLGEARTLVLIDGRRTVYGTPVGQGTNGGYQDGVDVSTIPTYLIDHVDVVTGGGSSAFGSEAVAGTVNIILKDHYDGVMVNQQYGLSTGEGDGKTEDFNLLAGKSFLDDTAHIVFGLNFMDQGAVFSRDRDISKIDVGANSKLPGGYQPSSYIPGGNFGTGEDDDLFAVLPGGGVAPYSGALYGFNRAPFRSIQIPTQHLSMYEKATYDITDNIHAYIDTRFTRSLSHSTIEPIALDGASTTIGFSGQLLSLPINNAFVPDALRALNPLDDGNGNFADWRRRFVELGSRDANGERTNWSVVAGLKGEIFDRFKWNAFYGYSEVDSYQTSQSGNVLKLQNALNTDVVNGQIVCADPAARADGCVPVNFFGAGNVSQAAVNYIKALKSYTDQNRQTLFDADINGPVYTLPYGDVRIAAGFEYRREDAYNRPDALSAQGFSLDTQQPASGGGYDVRDYFIEAEVPILTDLPMAKNLSIEGAFRYSDYSTIGGKQSYKYGLSYAPVEDIRFRIVNAIAIRAPNLSDLFQGRGQSATSVTDPCSDVGLDAAPNRAQRAANCARFPGVVPGFTENNNDRDSELSYSEGNTDLTNERAQVLTYGVVLQPRFVPGFSATVDAFKYKIANAIQTIDLQTAADQCADTLVSNFCDLVRRNLNPGSPNFGNIQGVDSKVINVGSLDERGIDVALTYGTPLVDILGAGYGDVIDSGRLDISWNYEFIQQLEYTTTSGVTTNQRGLFGAPHNKWNLNVLYSNDKLEVNYQLRYIGSQSYETGGLLGPTVAPFIYNDISARYHFTEELAAYIGMKNIFNITPPLVASDFQQSGAGVTSGVTGTNTVPDVYDIIGRFIYFGVNYKFGG